MKHTIREHIIDPVRGKIVKVSTINAELGSGILDKNGKEIFEGDRVKIVDRFYTVEFKGGAFIAFNDNGETCSWLLQKGMEIVGHVDD